MSADGVELVPVFLDDLDDEVRAGAKQIDRLKLLGKQVALPLPAQLPGRRRAVALPTTRSRSFAMSMLPRLPDGRPHRRDPTVEPGFDDTTTMSRMVRARRE